MFVVVVTLQPRPLPSLGLDERFTRIDYTAKCTMLDILKDMARMLRVPTEDITLLDESGDRSATLERTLGEYHDQHAELSSFFVPGKWHQWPKYVKRQNKQIKLKVKHTPKPQQLVTCTVQGGEGCNKLRRATVELPNTATFGELLELARKKRYGALEFEGPVYGCSGELDTTLRDAWVRNGCKIDGTLHIGLAVVVSFPAGSQKPLCVIMGPGDTINDLKQRVYAVHGFTPSQQKLMTRGGTQQLDDSVALNELLVSGVPVGGFSSAGWSELHLELRMRACALPSDSKFRATLGDESGGWPASLQNPDVGVSSLSSGVSRQRLPLCQSASLFSPVALDPHAAQETKAGCLRAGGGLVGDRLSTRPGGVPCSMHVFALSPSGRAFTLSMREGATVLDAKGQVAGFEGVSPSRQRLLWRGICMQPDSAHLHKIGVRNGDTLVVGYKLARPEVTTTPVDEPEGNVRVDTLVAEVMESEPHALGSDMNNGNGKSPESAPAAESAEAAADGESNAVVAREDSAAVAASADARARNDEVDTTGGEGGEGDSAPMLPLVSAAVQGNEEAGRRWAWWSRKKSLSTRRRGHSDEQGRDDNGNGGLVGVAVPPSASSSATVSSDAINGINARRVRVAPAPEVPVHLNASAGGIDRGIGTAGTDAVYFAATAGVPARQPLTPRAGRTNFAGWARWGRRMSAFSTVSDGGSGGRESGGG